MRARVALYISEGYELPNSAVLRVHHKRVCSCVGAIYDLVSTCPRCLLRCWGRCVLMVLAEQEACKATDK